MQKIFSDLLKKRSWYSSLTVRKLKFFNAIVNEKLRIPESCEIEIVDPPLNIASVRTLGKRKMRTSAKKYDRYEIVKASIHFESWFGLNFPGRIKPRLHGWEGNYIGEAVRCRRAKILGDVFSYSIPNPLEGEVTKAREDRIPANEINTGRALAWPRNLLRNRFPLARRLCSKPIRDFSRTERDGAPLLVTLTSFTALIFEPPNFEKIVAVF